MNDSRYLNFPVQMLSNFLTDTEQCIENIINYSIYEDSTKRNEESEYDRFVNSALGFGVNISQWRMSNTPLGLARELHTKYPPKSPKTGFKFEIYEDLKKGHSRKSEFEKVCFLAFLAAKSIVMLDSFKKINYLYLFSRMDGLTKPVKHESELSDPLKKYFTRHYKEKIRDDLFFSWNVVTYSKHNRGFYISTKLSIDEIIIKVELKNRKKEPELTRRSIIKEALNRVKNQIPSVRDTTQPTEIPNIQGTARNEAEEVIDVEIIENIEEIEDQPSRASKKKPGPSKIQFAENVKMTETEYLTLISDHGEAATGRMIQILDNYKGSKGVTYKSDYRAILSWVIDRYNKEKQTNGNSKSLADKAKTADSLIDSLFGK